MPTRAAPTHSVPTQTAPRFEVAEPSGKRHQLPVGELAKAWSAGQFEAGTLVKSPGSANWVPPYDLPELAGVAAPNLAATATAGRTTQLTFSDETVSLGVDESAALSRQAFAAQRALEGAPAARAVPSVPEDSGFEDEEVATVVRSLDQLNQLRELAQAPSKQPTLKPPSGVAVPPEALPSRPSPLPPRPPGPAPGVGGATPAAAAEAPLQRAIPKRHNPTLLGVPAPAIHGASPAPAAFVPGAAAPTAGAPSAAAPTAGALSAAVPGAGAPAAAVPATAATAAPHAVSAAPLKQPVQQGVQQPVQQGVQQPGEPTPAAPALHSSPPPAPVHARPSDISTAPPPPGEPLAERATEAAPVPPAFTAEWVNSSRMPALSSPSVPQLPTDEAAPPLGLSPPTDKNAPTFDPPSVETARALSQPGLAPASVEAFRSEVPPRSSSLGWIVTLVFLLLVGAGLGALYWKKPQLFFAGRDRIVELAQRAGRAVGLSSAPSRVAGPPFDTPSAGAVLERAAQQASGCAEPGGPTGRGRVKVLYQQDGRALNAVVSPPFHETQVGRCLVGLFKNTQVPAFGGEPVIVSKTFTVR